MTGTSRIVDEPPLPEPAPSPNGPVWDWRDAALFVAMSIPAATILYIIAMLIAKVFHLKPDSAPMLVIFQTVAYVVIFFMLGAILRFTYGAPFWRSLGWVPSTVPVAMAIAFGVSLAITITAIGGMMHVPNVDSPMKKLLSSPNGVLFLALFGTLVAPLAEELLFRGFLQPLMIRSLGVVAGIGLTSVLFGVMHLEENGRVWQYAVLISAAGLGFGVLRYLSGSTRTSIITHASYNGVLFLGFFFSGKGQ